MAFASELAGLDSVDFLFHKEVLVEPAVQVVLTRDCVTNGEPPLDEAEQAAVPSRFPAFFFGRETKLWRIIT